MEAFNPQLRTEQQLAVVGCYPPSGTERLEQEEGDEVLPPPPAHMAPAPHFTSGLHRYLLTAEDWGGSETLGHAWGVVVANLHGLLLSHRGSSLLRGSRWSMETGRGRVPAISSHDPGAAIAIGKVWLRPSTLGWSMLINGGDLVGRGSWQVPSTPREDGLSRELSSTKSPLSMCKLRSFSSCQRNQFPLALRGVGGEAGTTRLE